MGTVRAQRRKGSGAERDPGPSSGWVPSKSATSRTRLGRPLRFRRPPSAPRQRQWSSSEGARGPPSI